MSFEKLLSLNVNDKTEKKGSGKNALTYLSWSFAWSEFVKVYPDASYEILKNDSGLPYFIDSNGAMCYTKVTANNVTHEMWLPVMDGANKAMKSEAYTYQVKNKGVWDNSQRQYVIPAGEPEYIEKRVEALTMFDVNKTVMRCLVKNLAMFGLGLYIYAGEDLPEAPPEPPPELLTDAQMKKINTLLTELGIDRNKVKERFGVASLKELWKVTATKLIDDLEKVPKPKGE